MSKIILPISTNQVEDYIRFFLKPTADNSLFSKVEPLRSAIERYIDYTNPFNEFKINPLDFRQALLNTGFSLNGERCNASFIDGITILNYTYPTVDLIIAEKLNDDICFLAFYCESIRRFVQNESHESYTIEIGPGGIRHLFTYEDFQFTIQRHKSENQLNSEILTITTVTN